MTGAIIFFGFHLLGVIVMMTQRKDTRRYQQPATGGNLHFRRPLAERVYGALVSLSFLAAIPLSAGVVLNPKSFGPTTGSHAEDIGLVSIFYLIVSFAFSFLAGPDELFIDLSARTYHRTWGWLLFPKSASGSTGDILYVQVLDMSSVSTHSFHICLGWRGSKGTSIVGRYDCKEEAETAASKLKQLLGPQCIKLPFWM